MTMIGVPKVLGELAAIEGKLLAERGNACLAACQVFERKAKWYASGNAGGPHRRTGNLNNSIVSEKTGSDSAQVAPSVDYAAFVEYGTVNMGPFPYMSPAYESSKGEAERVLQERLAACISIKGSFYGGAAMGGSLYSSPLPEE